MTKIPAGYKLIPDDQVGIPKDLYEKLIAQMSQPVTVRQSTEMEDLPANAVKITTVKAHSLGDIHTRLEAGEEFWYVPKRSLRIRGRDHKELGSFLIYYNKGNGEWYEWDQDNEEVKVPVVEKKPLTEEEVQKDERRKAILGTGKPRKEMILSKEKITGRTVAKLKLPTGKTSGGVTATVGGSKKE